MKTKFTTKTVTYLNYSLSREEQEILAKSNKILEQILDAIEECSNIDVDDQHELVRYFHNVFGEDVDTDNFIICGIIDAIINKNNTNFIVQEEHF